MLLAECQLRRGRLTDAQRLLQVTLKHQHEIYGSRHVDLWPTIMLQAIAIDAEQGASAAAPAYDTASAMALTLLPPGHPDRKKVAVLRDLARYRVEPTAQHRSALAASIRAYGDVLAKRPDGQTFSVLSRELLEQGPTARLFPSPLLALMAY
jgi:hypothetical protein